MHLFQQGNRFSSGFPTTYWLMMADHVHHLKTYSTCRIEGGHRFLKDHRHSCAAPLTKLFLPSVKNIVSQQ
ncbi:Uncharacterised protein [Shigella sonnei]|nr:Uncharacterised protein [Shigella sonnei]